MSISSFARKARRPFWGGAEFFPVPTPVIFLLAHVRLFADAIGIKDVSCFRRGQKKRDSACFALLTGSGERVRLRAARHQLQRFASGRSSCYEGWAHVQSQAIASRAAFRPARL